MRYKILIFFMVYFALPVNPRSHNLHSRSMLSESNKDTPTHDMSNHQYFTERKKRESLVFPRDQIEAQFKTLNGMNSKQENARRRRKRGVEDQIFPQFGNVEAFNKEKKVFDDDDVVPSTPSPTTSTSKPAAINLKHDDKQKQPMAPIPVSITTSTPSTKPTFRTKKVFRQEVNHVFEKNKPIEFEDSDEDSESESKLESRDLKSLRVPDERTDFYGPRKYDDILKDAADPDESLLDCYIPTHDGNNGLIYDFVDLPPCKGLDLTPHGLEPIPYINYKGTLDYEEECWLNNIISDAQLVGISTTPSPGPSYPSGPLEEKEKLIEASTCKVESGLECVRNSGESEIVTTPEPGSVIQVPEPTRHIYGTCQCMNGFGDVPRKRVVIDKKCYIPAGMGWHSECRSLPKGPNYPLPAGDPVYEKDLWNNVSLPCVPNAKCVEHHTWYERRCACNKNFKKNKEKGTCDIGRELKSNLFLTIASLTTLFIHLMK